MAVRWVTPEERTMDLLGRFRYRPRDCSLPDVRVEAGRLDTAGLDWVQLVRVAAACETLARHLERVIRSIEEVYGRSRESRVARGALQPLWDCAYMVRPYRPYKPPVYLRDQIRAALQAVDYAILVLMWAREHAGTQHRTQPLLILVERRRYQRAGIQLDEAVVSSEAFSTQPGMVVYGSDGTEVGRVAKVAWATRVNGEPHGYLLVGHKVAGILTRYLYVPFSAVRDVVPGDCVTLLCTKSACKQLYGQKRDAKDR